MLAERDLSTQALMAIDYAHHEIHSGDGFFYQDAITLGAASQDYLITTPDTTKYAHFGFKVQHLKDVTITLFEASDKTGTTAQTIFNSDRNSAATSGLSIKKGTSGGTTDGTSLMVYLGGLAAGANVISGDLTHSTEIILKKNTKYLLRVTSGTAANTITTMMNWYEHTSKA